MKVILNIIIPDRYRMIEPFRYLYNRLSLFVVMQRIMTVYMKYSANLRSISIFVVGKTGSEYGPPVAVI